MARPRRKSGTSKGLVAENRKARFNYAIEDTLECGIVLTGSEVKALRNGQANISESYASVENGELYLINCHIARYDMAGRFGHEERRKRKLLVNRRELSRFWRVTERQGMTLVPLRLYFNATGRAKLLLAIARGRKLVDKRDNQKTRDWNRQKARLLRERG
ncbi:MAG: SsrA-binding protein SmpB [Paracoccaceae bacterium]|nr:SsrA-binding protein SmpB [Paracoccaceae bacterium]MDE2912272.1 SsrA-binding protein SmpB [Paracoccaceae bacterium]